MFKSLKSHTSIPVEQDAKKFSEDANIKCDLKARHLDM